MRAYARWRALDARQRWITLRCAIAIVAAMARLRIAGTQRALSWAHRPSRSPRASDTFVRDAVDGIERAARYLPGATCLPQSLALTRVLRGSGVNARVKLGVRAGTPLAAHAWVEHDGTPLTSERGFTPVGS